MGRILMTGGGGGADLDVITAEADDILSGKVIVDKDGNPLTGTLTLSGDAGAGDVLSGKTFYTTNPKSKQTGTMGTMGGGTYTPKAVQQTVSCSGKRMTGNIVIKGDGNLTGNNILYGKSIFGVSGNVRKYAVIDKTVTIASGTRAFDNLDSNSLTYDNYVAISLPSGFYATSINCNKPYAGYITSAIGDDGILHVWSNARFHAVSWNSKVGRTGTIYIPCLCSSENYKCRVFGYY